MSYRLCPFKENEVKFSNDADIASEDCEKLIKKHLQLSDQKAKMDQILFVKYAHIICMLSVNTNDHLFHLYLDKVHVY